MIVELVIFCGKQNIFLRGYRDDFISILFNKGNFWVILNLLVSNDEELVNYIKMY